MSCNGFDGSGCDIKLWDRRKGGVVQEYQGHSQSVLGCAFVGTQYIASASQDRTVKIWRRDSQECVATHKLSDGLSTLTACGYLFSPQESCLIMSSGTHSSALHLMVICNNGMWEMTEN